MIAVRPHACDRIACDRSHASCMRVTTVSCDRSHASCMRVTTVVKAPLDWSRKRSGHGYAARSELLQGPPGATFQSESDRTGRLLLEPSFTDGHTCIGTATVRRMYWIGLCRICVFLNLAPSVYVRLWDRPELR